MWHIQSSPRPEGNVPQIAIVWRQLRKMSRSPNPFVSDFVLMQISLCFNEQAAAGRALWSVHKGHAVHACTSSSYKLGPICSCPVNRFESRLHHWVCSIHVLKNGLIWRTLYGLPLEDYVTIPPIQLIFAFSKLCFLCWLTEQSPLRSKMFSSDLWPG